MINEFKDIDTKNRTYNFFDENLDPNKIKIDEKSYKMLFIKLDMRRSKT